MSRKVKVLLAKLGLDVHNRGLVTVAMELRDEGMEVIYLGHFQTAERIVVESKPSLQLFESEYHCFDMDFDCDSDPDFDLA